MSTELSKMKLYSVLLRLLEYAEVDGNFAELAGAIDNIIAGTAGYEAGNALKLGGVAVGAGGFSPKGGPGSLQAFSVGALTAASIVTLSGNAVTADAAWYPLFSAAAGVYVVSARLATSTDLYGAAAFVISDGTTIRVHGLLSANTSKCSIFAGSGTTVVAAQNSGGPQSIYFTATKVG